MKYLKMLGLASIAAAALMAFVGAGTASAATLTCSAGVHCAVGTVIHAESEGHATLDSPIGNIECTSTVEGTVTSAGTSTPTTQPATGHITLLKFDNCTNGAVVTVLKKGTLTIHSAGGGTGTLTSSGTEVTITQSGFHCIFTTSNTDIGTVTGGANPTLDIKATIPRTGGSSGIFCGSSAPWTGSYAVTKPKPLIID